MYNALYYEVLELLKQLISTPSFSKEEENTAIILENFFDKKNIPIKRVKNNLYGYNLYVDGKKPYILLNSHHDTVKPNKSYTLNPFAASIKDNKLYGLGSNDAGASLVCLIGAFIYFYKHNNLKYNLIIGISAEEEVSGKDGIELLLTQLPKIDFGIVGEPTLMNMAIAEKGLLVVDCIAKGEAAHVAHNKGVNAIDIAIQDIQWIKNFKFPKVSKLLGEIKMTVTVINAGQQHNVLPDECKFVIDIRITEEYTHEEVLEILEQNLKSSITPRSMRMRSSKIDINHPIVQSGLALQRSYYGSPTSSDKALIPYPTLKMGVGDSLRSHTADEFIYLKEIEEGLEMYIKLLENVIV